MSAALRRAAPPARPDEQAAVRGVVERLCQQFPHLDVDTVTRTVHARYHHLDQAPVRDFIPVLVERAAREQLRSVTSGRRC